MVTSGKLVPVCTTSAAGHQCELQRRVQFLVELVDVAECPSDGFPDGPKRDKTQLPFKKWPPQEKGLSSQLPLI